MIPFFSILFSFHYQNDCVSMHILLSYKFYFPFRKENKKTKIYQKNLLRLGFLQVWFIFWPSYILFITTFHSAYFYYFYYFYEFF